MRFRAYAESTWWNTTTGGTAMIKKIDHRNMGRSNLGWLNSWFHFSFAEYYNPENMKYGNLRVVNDDTVQPHTGFDVHPHRDMEIVTYVLQGELTHGDSMQNKRTLYRGEVQYMSAGTGIFHSEMNEGDEILRLLQIWILPDHNGYAPQYGEQRIAWEDRIDHLLHIVSSTKGSAPVKIHQDMNIYVSMMSEDTVLDIPVLKNRQVYLIVMEGQAVVEDTMLYEKDAAEISESFQIRAESESHIMMFEMPKEVE